MNSSVNGVFSFHLKEERVKKFLTNKPTHYVIRAISEVHAAAHRPQLSSYENSPPNHTPKSPSRLFRRSMRDSRHRVMLSSHKRWLLRQSKTPEFPTTELTDSLFHQLRGNSQLTPEQLLDLFDYRGEELQFALRQALGVSSLAGSTIKKAQFAALFRSDPRTEAILHVLEASQVPTSAERCNTDPAVVYDFTASMFSDSNQHQSLSDLCKVIQKWWAGLNPTKTGKVSRGVVAEKLVHLGLAAELSDARKALTAAFPHDELLVPRQFKKLFGKALLRAALLELARRFKRMTKLRSISPGLELSAYRRSLMMSKLPRHYANEPVKRKLRVSSNSPANCSN